MKNTHPYIQNEPTEEVFYSSSGVPLYLFRNPSLHSFCLSLYVRAGSMFEKAEENGITHLTEHLVFRSVNRQMNGTLYRELDRLGLCLEGCTYKEFVRFTVTGAREHFSEGAAFLLRILHPLSLTAEDLRLEKGRVKAEIREEREKTTLDFFTDAILHEGTSLARTITGTAGTVERLGITRLRAFHREMFSSKNIFFYATGDVSPENASHLSALLGEISLDEETARRENFAPVSAGFFHRGGGVHLKNSQRHMVRLSVDVDTALASDATLGLLYDLLFGDGEACRVHEALSESTGYIYSFRAGMELYRNVAVISVSYEITPALLLPSVHLLLDTIRAVKASTEGALAYVRAPYTDNAYLMLDSDSDLNFNRAYESQILALPYKTVSERAAAYAAVTDEDLSRLAARIFTPENMTLTVKGSEKTVDVSALKALIKTV